MVVPCVLVLDDLQWLDTCSWDVINEIRDVAGIVVVLCSRPAPPHSPAAQQCDRDSSVGRLRDRGGRRRSWASPAEGTAYIDEAKQFRSAVVVELGPLA